MADLDSIYKDSASETQAAELQALKADLGMVDESGKDIPEEGDTTTDRDLEVAQMQAQLGMAEEAESLHEENEAAKNQPPQKSEDGSIVPKHMVNSNIYGVPLAAARGFGKSAEGVINAGIEIFNWLENEGVKLGIGDGTLIPDDYKLDSVDSVIPEADGYAVDAITHITKFLAPFGAVSKAMKVGQAATAAGRFAKSASAGAIADFGTSAEGEGRLADLAQDVPVLAPMLAILMSEPDDSPLTRRAKAAVEGIILGSAVEGLFHGVRFLKAQKELSKAKQALRDVDDAKIAKQARKEKRAAARKEKGEAPLQEPEIDDSQLTLKGVLEEDEVATAAAKTVDEEVFAPKGDFYSLSPEDIATKREGPLNKYNGNLNLTKMNSNTDIVKAIDNFGTANKEFLEKARGSKTDAQLTEELAQGVGMSVDDLMAKRGKAFTSIELLQARTFLQAAAANFSDLAKAAIGGSDEALTAFKNAELGYAAIVETVAGATAEAGRAVRSMQHTVSADAKFRADLLRQTVEVYGGRGKIDKLAQRVAKVADANPDDFVRVMGKIRKKALSAKMNEAVYESFVGNILAGPGTHIKNTFSNTFQFGLTVGEEGMAEVFGKVGKGSTKAFLKGAGEGVDEAIQSISQQIADLFGIEKSVMAELAEHKANPIADTLKKTENFKPAITSENFNLQIELEPDDIPFTTLMKSVTNAVGRGANAMGAGKAIDAVGKVTRASLVILDGADDVAKIINYRAHIRKIAHNEALAKGLGGTEIAEYIAKRLDDPPSNIRMSSIQFAQKNTFTAPLTGHLATVDNFINIGSGSTAFGNVGPLKYLIPFSKTNLNLLHSGLERSPLAFRLESYKKAIEAGGEEAFKAKLKFAYGSVFMAGIGTIAAAGKITGRAPKDFRARKVWMEHNQEYSVKIGDTWVAYGEWGSLGTIMRASSDVGQILSYNHPTDNEPFAGLGESAVALIGNAVAPEFLTGAMGDLQEILHSGDTKKASKFIAKVTADATPIIGNKALAFIAKNQDSIIRDKNTMETFSLFEQLLNNYRAMIPGLSDTLPPVRNIWGEPVEFHAGTANGHYDPFYLTKDSKDPIMKEIERLGGAGLANAKNFKEGEKHLTIGMPVKSITIPGTGGKAINLTGEQYSRYVELSAGVGLDGPTLRQELNEFVKNKPSYLSDADAIKEINTIINYFRKEARAVLLEEIELGGGVQMDDLDDKLAPYKEESGGADVSF